MHDAVLWVLPRGPRRRPSSDVLGQVVHRQRQGWPMKWHPRDATGLEEIHQQHKMLFETADQVRQTLADGAGNRTCDLFTEAPKGSRSATPRPCSTGSTDRSTHRHIGRIDVHLKTWVEQDQGGHAPPRARLQGRPAAAK